MQMSKTFPLRLKHDVEFVMNIIANNSYSTVSITFSLDSFTTYQLKDEKVEIPYRMYYKELSDTVLKTFNETQFKILCCLYTRHNDGYIRQKYLEKLFDMNIDEWELPFIVKLCDEYVLEILELIYNKLANRTNDDIKQFCLNNENIIHRGYERMMSYWNAYYRHKGYLFCSYIGRKIFREYLGYDKEFRMDKIKMRVIDESKNVIKYIRENGNNNNIDIDWELLGCTNSDDMSIMHNCLVKMDQYGILQYNKKLNKIKFDIGKINLYEAFYCLRSELEQLLNFLYQLYRDTCAVVHCKKIVNFTLITRNMVIDTIYNFISTVVIGINKVLKDSNGKYNIEEISSRVGKFLKNNNMNVVLYRNEKKLFSANKKTLDNSISKFNDFRDEFFAHSDQNSQLKIKDVNVDEMLKILKLCINYCVKLINIIDDKEIKCEDVKNKLCSLDLESNYFSSLTIRK